MGVDMTTVFYVAIMAVVQGIAEFLPISSSGHLLFLGKFLELPDIVTLSILLHAGTLLSVLFYFSRDIIEALTSKFRAIGLVIVGTIPTVMIAFCIKYVFPELEESLLLDGCLLIVTGVLLITVLGSHTRKSELQRYYEQIERNAEDDADVRDDEPLTLETTKYWQAFVVGIAQGVAALPGLSRSGSTIATGVGMKFDREWAAKFSFLLSIPVIAGGALLEIIELFKEAKGDTISEKFFSDPLLVVYFGGAGLSFIVGWLSLAFLMRLLRDGKLHRFAYWLFCAGPLCIAYWCWENWGMISEFLAKVGLNF